MENLMEKLKGLDKKVWIGAGIGAAALIILIVVLVIGMGGNKTAGGNTQGSQSESQTGTQAGTENLGTENLGTETLGTEMSTEMETEIGTETEMTESESQAVSGGAQTSNGSELTATKPESVNGVEQNTVTTTTDGREVLGSGVEDEPYIETPVDMKVTTFDVPAGGTLYYSIYRIGGKYLTINDPDAYVIYGGRTIKAKNGVVSFKLKTELASTPIVLQIGNNGSAAKAFTLNFSDPLGSWDNPETVSSIVNQSTYQKSLSAGDNIGYYYMYKVEKTGTIRFYISATVSSGLDVQNNDTSNGTEGATFAESKYVLTDESGREYIKLDVTQGQILRIHICANEDENRTFPATTITWEAKYE